MSLELDLDAWQSGNEQAFADFYKQSYRLLHRVIYRMVRDVSETEDLLQDLYIKLYHKRHLYQEERSSLLSWAYRIAVNHTLNYLKRRKLLRRFHVEKVHHASLEVLESDSISEKVMIEQTLEALSEMQRTILILRDVEDQSYEAIAGILSIPIGTVRSRLHRARRDFKMIFERKEQVHEIQ